MILFKERTYESGTDSESRPTNPHLIKMNKILISVRLPQPLQDGSAQSNSSLVEVNVDPSDSGGDLRRAVARLSEHQPGDIRLIFAGKLVNDVCTLKELQITENTIIHAITAPKKSPVAVYGDDSLQDADQVASTGVAPWSHGDTATEHGSKKPSFYVYCKQPCWSVQPGKLRVCCSQCNQDAFTVNKDPSCWDDVLLPGRISGRCHMQSCAGQQAKFYFKCVSHRALDGDRVVPLPLLKTNTRRIECLTCGDVMSPIIVFDCSASHVVCANCFTRYCQLCLSERRFVHDPDLGYTLPCPARCEDSLIKETHHFLLMGKDQYTRYKQFGAEECLLQEGGVLCPSPGCGAGILPDADERRVVCERGGFGCGFVFCKDCHEAFHDGECGQRREEPEGQRSEFSSVDLERERQARWEREESQRTIERTSKPCPKCRAPTERNGGCMHMTCSRAQCRFDWCWLCSKQWNSECLEDHWFGPYPQ